MPKAKTVHYWFVFKYADGETQEGGFDIAVDWSAKQQCWSAAKKLVYIMQAAGKFLGKETNEFVMVNLINLSKTV